MFKDHIAADIGKAFIDTTEHGSTASINGANISIVQDNDRLEYRLMRDTAGLLRGDILFYISKTEFAKIPKVTSPPRTGEAVIYNGKPATMTSVVSNVGVYEIVLEFAGTW